MVKNENKEIAKRDFLNRVYEDCDAEDRKEFQQEDTAQDTCNNLLGCTPSVAQKILAARGAIIKGDINEAYYQLYSIASPGLNVLDPWADLEKLAAAKENINGG